MQLIRTHAYARAGLVGNPSDGFHGKTISLALCDFRAEIVLYEWDEVEVLSSQEDRSRFHSVQELAHDVELHGYYGGIRLVKATIKRFVDYCRQQGITLHERTFAVRYTTNIPRQVGLAGSSAIIVASLRALCEFYGVTIEERIMPSLALSVETEELGIPGGLQDRVVQVYQGLVYMDFSSGAMEQVNGLTCGRYERLDSDLLPPLYIAYSTDNSEPTEVFHNNLRQRFIAGESAVVAAMQHFAELATQARKAILDRDHAGLSRTIDENFNTRLSICQLPAGQVRMVETARRLGASAKFAGSGGAIIGTLSEKTSYEELQHALAGIGCHSIRV